MTCEKCNQWKDSLISTYAGCDKAFDVAEASRRRLICNDCMIGQFVPAYRTSIGHWKFGTVLSSREHSLEFLLQFEDRTKEWVKLEASPFEAYLASYRQRMKHKQQEYPRVMTPRRHPGFRNVHHKSVMPKLSTPPRIIDREKRHGHEMSIMEHYDSLQSPNDSTESRQTTPQKSSPRLWSIEEDQKLLRAITQVPKPIKWPEVAALVPQRSGKQCRERYFNHLCAKVKSSEWLPWEDAMLIRMYSLLGSKWSKISRTIPGRTDNSLKNRFHYMRRQIEKYGNSIPHRASVVPSPLKRLVDGVCTKMTKQHDELTFTICDIFLDALSTGKRLLAPIDDAAYFGKFHPPRVPAPCTRCGLIVPSSQTGTTMCSKTGWCRACFETPTFIRDGLLRLEHSLRASGDRKRISFCASD